MFHSEVKFFVNLKMKKFALKKRRNQRMFIFQRHRRQPEQLPESG